MEMLHEEPGIDTFVMLSGDKDYMPALKKVKKKGKTSVMMGHGSRVARIIKESADYFVDLESMNEDPREVEPPAGIDARQLAKMPVQAGIHRGIAVPNEGRSIMLPAGEWLDVFEGMVVCIKAGETTFTGVMDFIKHDVQPGFPPSLLVPVMNTFVHHGLFAPVVPRSTAAQRLVHRGLQQRECLAGRSVIPGALMPGVKCGARLGKPRRARALLHVRLTQT